MQTILLDGNSLTRDHVAAISGGAKVSLDANQLERELDWLTHRTRRLLWLNPLLRFDGYAPLARGAAVLARHAHGMLAVHNLSKLEDLASSLAAVMRR